MTLEVEAGRSPVGAPQPQEVADLYAAASMGPPLSEPRAQADGYGDLFSYVLTRDDATWLAARDEDRLVGLAFGHGWAWECQGDPWSQQLRDRLGEAAGQLEGCLAVYLVVVHPDVQRQGLGRRLLAGLLEAAQVEQAWLPTRDADTPARAMLRQLGWRKVGHGPDAADGRPGLVMVLGVAG